MKVFVAKSNEELKNGYNRAIAKNHAMMIQEIIPGGVNEMHGFNAYYDHNHIPIGKFMYKRIREWPHNYGNGCLIENIQLPELEEIITPLIKKIKYYGIVDVEFKKDYRDGLFKIIEINTRFWMQNSFPTRCGINLPYIAYCDAVNISIKKPLLKNEKIKWLYLSDDIRSSLKSMRNRTLSLHDWVISYQGKKEYALFAKDDPLPFFDASRKNMLLAVPYIFKSLKRNN
jgi:predicted ATP-grasp superfamily ATP-dependent carboligase